MSKGDYEARDLAQRVSTLAAFTEDPGSVPKTHIVVYNHL